MSCCRACPHDAPLTTLPSSDEVPKREPFQVRTFYLCLCLPSSHADHAPRSLTLAYAPLEESEPELSYSVPTSSVALRRVWSLGSANSEETVYASTRPLNATSCRGGGAGIRFEAYVGEERVAAGLVQRDWEGRWEMECWLAPGVVEVRGVGEGMDLRRSARWSPRAWRRQRREPRFVSTLQRIPEEDEVESQTAMALDDGKCYGGEGWAAAKGGYGGGYPWQRVHWDGDNDGWKTGSYQAGPDDEWRTGLSQEMRWAVGMGVWAACVGVGLLLSRAAASGLRKGFFLL